MRFSIASAILALSVVTSASAEDHQVTVGANSTLAFSPTSVAAQANDTITFIFSPRNHTVTQSNFTAPCLSLAGGVDSGFEPVSANATEVVSFTITVNDTNASWWYCRQTSHCQNGMVFAINPTANETFEQFQATANASAANGTPSSNSTSPSSTVRSSGSVYNPTSTTTSTTSSNSSNSASSVNARSGGLLAAIGFVAGILL